MSEESPSRLSARLRVNRGLQLLQQMRSRLNLLSILSTKNTQSPLQTDYGSAHLQLPQSRSAVLPLPKQKLSRTLNSSGHIKMHLYRYSPLITLLISIPVPILRRSCDRRRKTSLVQQCPSSRSARVSVGNPSLQDLGSRCCRKPFERLWSSHYDGIRF